jgi:hypothetical protein
MDAQVKQEPVPKLVTWAKQYTDEALELILWCADPDNGEDIPTRDWLANNPEAAADLWRRYQQAMRG